MSLNEVHLNTAATPESYTGTVVTKTKVALPPVVEQNGFPRFTRGEFSGAVFLMINPTFGYSVTDGTNCFLPLGEVVTSMNGMVEYHDEDGKYDEHLAHHVGIYQAILDGGKPSADIVAQDHVEQTVTGEAVTA